MLRVEQLRSKQNESTTCSLSRKRKLSELYYATVNVGDRQAATQTHEYHVKLEAFLDANDSEKGRLFSESTLPPRTRITRLHPHGQPSQSLHTSIDTFESSSNKSETTKSHRHVNGAVQPTTADEVSAQVLTIADSGVKDSTEEHEGGEPDLPSRDMAKRKREDDDVSTKGSKPGPSEATLGQHERARKQQRLDSPARSPRTRSARLPSPAQSKNAADISAGSAAPGALHQKTLDPYIVKSDKGRREKSPLVLAPVSATADPQSSPASTDGPGSSNTPAPTAGSPTTSPGDEDTVVHLKDFDHTTTDSETKENNTHSTGDSQAPVPSDLVSNHPDGDRTQHPTAETNSMPPPTDHIAADGTSSGSTQLSSSRKPNMRIDTQDVPSFEYKPKTNSGLVESPAPMSAMNTPRRTLATTPGQTRTRIQSGALRQKSVSEILGENPKAAALHSDKSPLESPVLQSTKDASQSMTVADRLAEREKREKERSKLSTVVFAKPHQVDDMDSSVLLRQVSGGSEHGLLKERDYLYTLFESRAYSPPRGQSLGMLIQQAHKTVSTSDQLIEYQEQLNCRILRRIYQLQDNNRWALRQRKRAEEAARPTSHWDFLLDHAKWMRTDFREERKWKMAAARGVAEWCAEWYASSPEEKRQLQVRVKVPTSLTADHEMTDADADEQQGSALAASHETPELMNSTEENSISDGVVEDPADLPLSQAPAAIFSLGASDFSFTIDKTPASDKLLNELPLYEPARIEPDVSKSDLAERLDARWKKDIVPVSRFATAKLKFNDPEPPRKRSRYEYDPEPICSKESKPLPPEQDDVALFMLENKHIRDRIHPGHSFRPPSEHPMPSQGFFESRSSSQWTNSDDDELKRLVKEYSYNWSLISSCLSSRAMYHSGADRRTPWECFERWIGLEGLPADMSKTAYFKAYSSRIEAASRHVAAKAEEEQKRLGANAQITTRKRTNQPIRVERKRAQKHLAMIDAFRKLAKKRETALQKQQHAAELAAARKNSGEANHPKVPYSTPAEFSALKHDRELKLAERQEMYRQSVLAHQKAARQQQLQLGQTNGVPNALPRNAVGIPNGTPATTVLGAMPNGVPGAPNTQRPHPIQSIPNGVPHNMPVQQGMMIPKGMTQTQIQAGVRGGHISPENARAYAEAVRIQQQHILAQQARQASSQNGSLPGNHSSPNMPNVGMANGNTNNFAMMENANISGLSSPPISGPRPNGPSASPRNANSNAVQALSSGHIPAITQIAAQIRARHPDMSPEDVQRHASEQLSSWQQATVIQGQKRAMNQAAINAAVGAANAGQNYANSGMNNSAVGNGRQMMGMMTNEQVQQYHNQQMRIAQQQRANAGMQGNGMPNMMAAMSGSPILNMARPVSQHSQSQPTQQQVQMQGQISRSATPRDQRSGSGSNGVGVGVTQASPRQMQPNMQT